MLFLTSLIYVLLAYVLVGELLIEKLAIRLAGGGKHLSAEAYLLLLNVALYLIIWVSLHMTKATYEDLQLTRERSHKAVKAFLDVNGCVLLNTLGLLSVAAGMVLLHWKDLLPIQVIPLFGAVLLGLANVSTRRDLAVWRDDPRRGRFSDLSPAPEAGESVKTVEWTWHFASNNEPTLQPYTSKFNFGHAGFAAAQATSRFPSEDPKRWARYVREGVTDDLKRVASELDRLAREMRLSKIQEAKMVASVVRGIPTMSMLPDGLTKQPSFPMETLYLQTGDDSDHALLAATLLTLLEHRVALLVAATEGLPEVAVCYCPGSLVKGDTLAGVFSMIDVSGHRYHYLETSPTGSGMVAKDRATRLFKYPDKINLVTIV